MSTDPWASLARLGAAIDRSDPALRNAAIDSLLDPGVWAEIDAIADRFDRGADPHPTDEARVATVFRARMALAAGAPRPDPSADALAAIDRLGASRAGAGWVLDDDGWARCAVGFPPPAPDRWWGARGDPRIPSEPALVQAIRSGAGGGSGADRASALRAAVAFGCALSDPEREALELAIRDAVTDLGSAGPEIGFVAAGLGHVALYLGRTDDAIALLTAGVDGLAADGTPAEQAIAGIDLAAALRVAGRLPDAHRALAACPAGSADVLRGYEQGRLAVTEGRAAEATVALERALVGASEPWPRLGILRWLVRARAAAGDPAGAAGWSAQLEREARAVIGPARPAALALIAEAGRPVAPTDLVY